MDYTIVGKSLQINDRTYDWSAARLYSDGGFVRLSVWNIFGEADYYNPLDHVNSEIMPTPLPDEKPVEQQNFNKKL